MKEIKIQEMDVYHAEVQSGDHPFSVVINPDSILRGMDRYREFRTVSTPLIDDLLGLILFCVFHNRPMLNCLSNDLKELTAYYLKNIRSSKNFIE